MKESKLLEKHGVATDKAGDILANALIGADDGEIYLQSIRSEALSFDDGRLKSTSYSTDQGFGLRVVAGEASGFAHSGEISLASLQRAADVARSAKRNYAGKLEVAPKASRRSQYTEQDPIAAMGVPDKADLLAQIDAYLRAKDPRVVQVHASLAANHSLIELVRANADTTSDIRPLVRLGIQVTVEQDGRRENGSAGCGGRSLFTQWVETSNWKAQADRALKQALINLDAVHIKGGEMVVVLGPGWPAVLLHEAVGHGLEGDFNRKGVSAFSGKVGEQVAAKGVTIIDQGDIPHRRGSLNIDDEGSPTGETVLIEDGILKGYMQDRQNARLMGVSSTGNARRQSYDHQPMPRMTNTFMRAGSHDPQEIIESVNEGIYAVDFGGGQVDITSGKFVFNCTLAYKIEKGKLGAPIKGATIIGDGPVAMQKVSMIGSDLQLDPGVGVCGKAGQGVAVGVGQPTLRLDGITVGGAG